MRKKIECGVEQNGLRKMLIILIKLLWLLNWMCFKSLLLWMKWKICECVCVFVTSQWWNGEKMSVRSLSFVFCLYRSCLSLYVFKVNWKSLLNVYSCVPFCLFFLVSSLVCFWAPKIFVSRVLLGDYVSSYTWMVW